VTLPYAVQQKLADKREWSALIGICSVCHEEVYANKDGILRTRLLFGSRHCLTKDLRDHVIGRYYLTGPGRWIRKWGELHGLTLPDWARYYQDNYMNGAK